MSDIKVKVFRYNNSDKFEERLNGFMQGKHIVDIKYSSELVTERYSNKGLPCTSSFHDSALVIYQEGVSQAKYIKYLQRKLDKANITYRTEFDLKEVEDEKEG